MSTPTLQETYPAPSLELPWQQDAIALRRDFHAHPELGFAEVRSAGIIAARLRALGLEVREGVGGTGVVGLLRGGGPGPVVLLRADMDALPVREANDWPWKSATEGTMHACGHDCHMATALTTARLLAAETASLHGTVKFVFQPAEEGLGGAARMIDDGLLLDPVPDYAFALHVWSDIEVGQIGISPGAVMAAADSFTARIEGRGGHGAMPHQTIDPIVAAAHVITALQSVVARNIAPQEAGVITIGRIQAGSAFNIIPGEATLEGTVRAFDEAVRATLEQRLREIVEGLPPALGARGTLDYQREYPVTFNDSAMTEVARRAAVRVVGADNVIPVVPTLGAEDMSLVLQKIPGCYFFVGGRNAAIDAVYPHHHPRFNIDERAMEIGARTMAEIVKECLGGR